MQTIKSKISDISAMRKAKSEAKEEEKVRNGKCLYVHGFHNFRSINMI